MGFEVICAIDLSEGRLARFDQGTRVPMTAFGGDPVEAASAFVEAGARWLHVVDMDLAFDGESKHLDLIARLTTVGASVQASGGVGTRAQADALLAAGVARVVLGSAALADRAAVERMATDLGDRLLAGLEAEEGWLVPRGSTQGVRLQEEETVGWLETVPLAGYMHTSVARVGEMEGPDLAGVAALRSRTSRPVYAGGGVATVADIRALAALGADAVVLGRSLYDGDLDVREATAERAP